MLQNLKMNNFVPEKSDRVEELIFIFSSKIE
jgi:hypothetical protein